MKAEKDLFWNTKLILTELYLNKYPGLSVYVSSPA